MARWLLPVTASVALLAALLPAPAVALPCAICTLGCPELNCPHGIGVRTGPCDCCPPCAIATGQPCKLPFSCAPGLICAPLGGKNKNQKFCLPAAGSRRRRSGWL
ncbi:insulin-like growth factor-binding protein 1 [Pollicipes pollicipes]|uniref:insulin-like growth factor-binding protein 1 n=1 Tax=Pollicipes pollicipes TaxID=41117 RepID=UPI001884E696|nr:insulin-like growth factor-binding protein 1 [Pollicipes pollicipes]